MDKREIFETLLATGNAFSVGVAPGLGAVLPASLLQDAGILLDFGLNLPAPTDAFVNDDGVAVTLRFNGVLFPCFIPWAAVHVINNTADDACEWSIIWHFAAAPAAKPTLSVVK